MRSGYKAGRRVGWGPLAPGAYVAYITIPVGPRHKELTVGLVLVNDRSNQQVTVQTGEEAPVTGTVTELKVVDGEPQLQINSRFYALQDVIHVKATDGANDPQSEE